MFLGTHVVCMPICVRSSVKLSHYQQLLTSTKSDTSGMCQRQLERQCHGMVFGDSPASVVNGSALQAAASELMVAEAEKAKWQSSIDEVSTCIQLY